MTLEAALVVPMALCSIVLLIYFAFFLYGRCLLTQDAYILAFRATIRNSPEWEDNPASYVEAHATDVLGKKYFGNRKPSVSGRFYGREVTVEGESQTRHTAMGRYFLKPKEGWNYYVSMTARKREVTKHIRRFKRLKDIGKDISDGI